jgi:hypothetical protein
VVAAEIWDLPKRTGRAGAERGAEERRPAGGREAPGQAVCEVERAKVALRKRPSNTPHFALKSGSGQHGPRAATPPSAAHLSQVLQTSLAAWTRSVDTPDHSPRAAFVAHQHSDLTRSVEMRCTRATSSSPISARIWNAPSPGRRPATHLRDRSTKDCRAPQTDETGWQTS